MASDTREGALRSATEGGEEELGPPPPPLTHGTVPVEEQGDAAAAQACDAAAKAMPVGQRAAHRDWKARLDAAGELADAAGAPRVTPPSSSSSGPPASASAAAPAAADAALSDDAVLACAEQHGAIVCKLVSDSNAAVQEQSLLVLERILIKLPPPSCPTDDGMLGIPDIRGLCSVMVDKCLPSARAKIKSLADECCLMLVELAQASKLVEALLLGSKNKTPKTAFASLHMLCRVMSEFGPTLLPMKEISCCVSEWFKHRDSNVRKEAMDFLIEVSKWFVGSSGSGNILQIFMKDLSPVQMKELEAACKDLVHPGAPKRVLRSKRNTAASKPEVVVLDVAMLEKPVAPAKPVNILKSIKNDWFTTMATGKWLEKKQKLEDLVNLANVPLLEDGDYSNIISSLKKTISEESNVNVVSKAIEALGKLGAGLRISFSGAARQLVSLLLMKFKDKKLTKPLHETLLVFSTVNFCFTEVLSDIQEALESKDSGVVQLTAIWIKCTLERNVVKHIPTVSTIDAVLKIFSKVTDHKAPEVREEGCLVLAALLKLFPKEVQRFIESFDPQKQKKIQTYSSESPESKLSSTGRLATTSNSLSSTITATSNIIPKKEIIQAPVPPPASTHTIPSTGKQTTKETVPPAKATTLAKEPKQKSQDVTIEEPPLSDDLVLQKAISFLPENLPARLADKNWRERLQASEALIKFISDSPPTPDNGLWSYTLVALLDSSSPTESTVGCGSLQREPNVSVAASFVNLFCLCARTDASLLPATVFRMCNAVVSRICETKVHAPSIQCIQSCAASRGSAIVIYALLCAIGSNSSQFAKTPKLLCEVLSIIGTLIDDLGTQGVSLKQFVCQIKPFIEHTTPQVKTAAVKVVASASKHLGPELRKALGDCSKLSLEMIDKETTAMEVDLPSQKPSSSTVEVKPALMPQLSAVPTMPAQPTQTQIPQKKSVQVLNMAPQRIPTSQHKVTTTECSQPVNVQQQSTSTTVSSTAPVISEVTLTTPKKQGKPWQHPKVPKQEPQIVVMSDVPPTPLHPSLTEPLPQPTRLPVQPNSLNVASTETVQSQRRTSLPTSHPPVIVAQSITIPTTSASHNIQTVWPQVLLRWNGESNAVTNIITLLSQATVCMQKSNTIPTADFIKGVAHVLNEAARMTGHISASVAAPAIDTLACIFGLPQFPHEANIFEHVFSDLSSAALSSQLAPKIDNALLVLLKHSGNGPDAALLWNLSLAILRLLRRMVASQLSQNHHTTLQTPTSIDPSGQLQVEEAQTAIRKQYLLRVLYAFLCKKTAAQVDGPLIESVLIELHKSFVLLLHTPALTSNPSNKELTKTVITMTHKLVFTHPLTVTQYLHFLDAPPYSNQPKDVTQFLQRFLNEYAQQQPAQPKALTPMQEEPWQVMSPKKRGKGSTPVKSPRKRASPTKAPPQLQQLQQLQYAPQQQYNFPQQQQSIHQQMMYLQQPLGPANFQQQQFPPTTNPGHPVATASFANTQSNFFQQMQQVQPQQQPQQYLPQFRPAVPPQQLMPTALFPPTTLTQEEKLKQQMKQQQLQQLQQQSITAQSRYNPTTATTSVITNTTKPTSTSTGTVPALVKPQQLPNPSQAPATSIEQLKERLARLQTGGSH
ncbi:cytoskeleton-associated protein 5 [Pelomyxa schiedti]|nr:cytoskeleton-associated protein 5 [Pelomyxa schiedti]